LARNRRNAESSRSAATLSEGSRVTPTLEKSLTGINGFDEITKGGVPQGRPTIVCGGPGCGKTMFALEFLVRGAMQYDEPGVLMTFEETTAEMTKNVASLGFDLKELEARKKLFSVDGDADGLAEVLRLWLARHQRFGSALYLAGESYGTTRGAAIADKLHAMGVSLQGMILVSCAMDLQSLVFVHGNDLPYALFLPAFANAAQFHGRLSGPLAASPQAAREAAEAFVNEEYLAALHAGARLASGRVSVVLKPKE